MAGALSVGRQRGAWIKVVTELRPELSDRNTNAIRALVQAIGIRDHDEIRILANNEGLSLLHSKLIIGDSRVGYLGSANLSKRGLEDNF